MKSTNDVWLIGGVICIALVALLYLHNRNKKLLAYKPPKVYSQAALSYAEKPKSRFVQSISQKNLESTTFAAPVAFEVKPSPKGTVKLVVESKEMTLLISDLRPFACPQEPAKMCLRLNDGNYIQADKQMQEIIPASYRYYIRH